MPFTDRALIPLARARLAGDLKLTLGPAAPEAIQTHHFPGTMRIATQVCYAMSMSSVTSSFRMSKELQRELSHAAESTGKVKNVIIIEALVKHLHAIERESLAGEARRQSELVSRNENDADSYGLADTSGWS